MKSIGKICAVCLAVVLFTSIALAEDIITMKDGSVKKGKIVEETKTHITLERFGTKFKLELAKIKDIKRGVKTTKQEYQERYRKIDRKDPLDLLDLADWCNENGLPRKAERLYSRVIRIEPDNEEAREALGHRKVDSKWMTKEEYREYKTKKAAGKATSLPGGSGGKGDGERKSLAVQGGKDVKSRAQAMLVKHKAESTKLAKEMIDEIGLDEVAAAITDHYILAGQVTQEIIDQLAVRAELVYADMSARFNHAPDYDLYKALRKKHIILFFKNRTDFSDGYDFAAKKWAPGLMRSKNFAMESGGGFGSASIPFDIFKHLRHMDNNVANDAAQDFTFWHTRFKTQEAKENGRFLPWLRESMGCWSAILQTGKNFTVRTTKTVYDPAVEIAKKRGEAGMRLLVKEWATGKMKKAVYSRDLRTMMMQKLNRLSFVDLAIGYGLVDFCIREHHANYKKFLILIREKPYLAAWQEAFGVPLVPMFEKKFKEWVKANY